MKKTKRIVESAGRKRYPKIQTTKLETLYLQIQPLSQTSRQDNSSLRQPSALKVINSVTTYGAYENPI